MNRLQNNAILALAGAGVLWGLTVPLSKVSLGWLGPAWLTAVRFAIAAPLLALVSRRNLRAALTPGIGGAGAVGFGAVVLLQNAGIERTSVSQAAVLVGAVPVLVALISATVHRDGWRPLGWGGNILALGGVFLVAGGGGGAGAAAGDGLVLASSILSAAFVVIQPRMLAGRDAAAVTAVQFAAAGLVSVPVAIAFEGAPAAPESIGPVLAVASLALAGTLLPFWLFASGQARVRAELAGAYLNLEPVVGAVVGWIAFGDRAGAGQLIGLIVVIAGIALTTLPHEIRLPERVARSS